jgi:hypothetical protein
MSHRRSWVGQAVLFFVLALVFSALPFVCALLLNKSSIVLAFFITWYAVVPPVVFLLLGWLLYHAEPDWRTFVGRVWIGVGIWFAVQYLLGLASGLHVIVTLLTLPTMTVGGTGFLVGALLFLGGGIALALVGHFQTGVSPTLAGRRGLFLGATAALLGIVLIGLPLFVILTTGLPDSISGGPAVPTEDEIFGWIEAMYNMGDTGDRRTGSEADRMAIDYLQEQLRAFGFTEVHAEPYTFDYWEPTAWAVTVSPGADDAEELASFYVPYSAPTGPEGLTGNLVYLGEGGEVDFEGADVAGRIILVELPPIVIGWDQQKLFTFMAFDPENTVGAGEEAWQHPYPIGWMIHYEEVYERALAHDVAGIVGILQDYPDMGEFTYYGPYDGILRAIPSLYVMEDDGQRLIEAAQAGDVTVRLVLDAAVSRSGGETATVYGVLPGRSDTIIFVHSHHDAPFRSGVEDSSGCGMVLALARYYAQIPEAARPRTMVFAFTGSHMVGAPSNDAFIEAHRDDIMANMLFDVAIEHIADDYNPPAPPTGLAEPRGIFITENPVAVSLVAQAVARHGLYRTLLFPTGTPLGVPTDAGPFQHAGYPVISNISGPTWLFDDDDTLDRVARDQLVPLTEMYIDLIGGMNRVGDPLLRFNLNVWTIVLVAVVLTPLAALSAIAWPPRP